MLSRLNTILERDRRTDRRTDGQNSYISIVRRHCVIKMQQSSYRVAQKVALFDCSHLSNVTSDF